MKKSLTAAIIMLFTFIGATALASKLDLNVKRNAIKTADKTGGSNGTGGRNQVSREK